MKRRTTKTSTVAGQYKPQNWTKKPEFAANLPSVIPDKPSAYAIERQNSKGSQAVPDMLTSDFYALKTEPPPELPDDSVALEPPPQASVDGTGVFYFSLIPNQGELFPHTPLQQPPYMDSQPLQQPPYMDSQPCKTPEAAGSHRPKGRIRSTLTTHSQQVSHNNFHNLL